jgi:hypothetical protein
MPKRIEWTGARDQTIKRMRNERASWDVIAAAVGVCRWAAIERGRQLFVRLRPPVADAQDDGDRRRDCFPAGHPVTWGAITKGTSLEGAAYG